MNSVQNRNNQGPVLTGDFASEHDINKGLSRAFANMSPAERDRILEDVHGVSDDIDETPEMISRNLAAFDQEINRLMRSNDALRMAMARDYQYVQNPDLRMQFLRAESHDAKAAADRFGRHFEMKRQLFGEEKLTKDIVQDDLDEDTMEYLYSGRFQNLPLRDKAGRHCSLFLFRLSHFQPNSDIAIMRRIYYNAMINAESVETQRKGIVVILWWGIGTVSPQRTFSARTFWQCSAVQRAMPVKVMGMHFCYDNIILKPIMSTIQLGCDFFTGVRFRSHYGNHSEIVTALQSFGIPANLIPINSDGTVTSKEFHVAQMEKRRKYERQEFPTVTVMIPGSFDILIGKGKPFQDHKGNTELREWIRRNQYSYEVAQKYEKKKLVLQVIQMVKARGGRFLKDDGGYWSEVEEEVARAKVGHLFRDKKRSREPKAAAANRKQKAMAMTNTR